MSSKTEGSGDNQVSGKIEELISRLVLRDSLVLLLFHLFLYLPSQSTILKGSLSLQGFVFMCIAIGSSVLANVYKGLNVRDIVNKPVTLKKTVLTQFLTFPLTLYVLSSFNHTPSWGILGSLIIMMRSFEFFDLISDKDIEGATIQQKSFAYFYFLLTAVTVFLIIGVSEGVFLMTTLLTSCYTCYLIHRAARYNKA